MSGVTIQVACCDHRETKFMSPHEAAGLVGASLSRDLLIQSPSPWPSPEGEGADWGMLSIIGGLFAAPQRDVENGGRLRLTR